MAKAPLSPPPNSTGRNSVEEKKPLAVRFYPLIRFLSADRASNPCHSPVPSSYYEGCQVLFLVPCPNPLFAPSRLPHSKTEWGRSFIRVPVRSSRSHHSWMVLSANLYQVFSLVSAFYPLTGHPIRVTRLSRVLFTRDARCSSWCRALIRCLPPPASLEF
jgi:hypothetical protein